MGRTTWKRSCRRSEVTRRRAKVGRNLISNCEQSINSLSTLKCYFFLPSVDRLIPQLCKCLVSFVLSPIISLHFNYSYTQLFSQVWPFFTLPMSYSIYYSILSPTHPNFARNVLQPADGVVHTACSSPVPVTPSAASSLSSTLRRFASRTRLFSRSEYYAPLAVEAEEEENNDPAAGFEGTEQERKPLMVTQRSAWRKSTRSVPSASTVAARSPRRSGEKVNALFAACRSICPF